MELRLRRRRPHRRVLHLLPAQEGRLLGPAADPHPARRRLHPAPAPRGEPVKTLRARMVLTVVGLAAIALIVVNVTGVLVLQRYLVDRLDMEVTRLAQVATRPPEALRPVPGLPRGVG